MTDKQSDLVRALNMVSEKLKAIQMDWALELDSAGIGGHVGGALTDTEVAIEIAKVSFKSPASGWYAGSKWMFAHVVSEGVALCCDDLGYCGKPQAVVNAPRCRECVDKLTEEFFKNAETS